jgi:hypothetical protein
MLEEEQSRLVCPLQVLEDKHQRGRIADPKQHLSDAVEEVATLLLRWQLERWRQLWPGAPQTREQPRHLTRRVAEDLPKAGRRKLALKPLQDLDEREIGEVSPVDPRNDP